MQYDVLARKGIKIDRADYDWLLAAGKLEGIFISKKGQSYYAQNRQKKYLHRLIMNPPKIW